ncbi:MAG: DUF6311 domain-containing protein [Sphingomonas sp.]
MTRRWLTAIPFVLLPIALFLALFHPALLDIGNAGWLIRGTDLGENALGLHAYLHDPDAGLSLRTTLLNAPEGIPLLFTDSNPLLGLLLKPVAGLLPADAQFVGPWLLLCLVLQTLFAWLLLRDHAPSRASLWCGVALLCALPTLYNRFGHANLFAHWLILWALWLFVDARRAADLRWWAPLIAITALVHSYLLIMVGAIWASAMLERFVRARGWVRGTILVQGVIIVGLVAILAAWIGATGHYELAGDYGALAMPLDALVNPANLDFGTILPATAQRDGRGFEGFQYLGLGLLLLLPIAGWAMARVSPAQTERSVLRRLLWLVPALIVLTALAIGNQPDIAGHALGRFPLPAFMAPVLDMVRASGRLFWPVAYTIVFVTILAVYRLRGRATWILAVLLVVQLVDVAGMAKVVRKATSDPGGQMYVRTADPRWQSAIAAAADVTFMTGEPTDDLALYQEVAWRAVSLQRPVRVVYSARRSVETAARMGAERNRFLSGALDPTRLYVLLPGSPVPAGVGRRLAVLDGTKVVLPAAAAPAQVIYSGQTPEPLASPAS